MKSKSKTGGRPGDAVAAVPMIDATDPVAETAVTDGNGAKPERLCDDPIFGAQAIAAAAQMAHLRAH